MILKECLSPVPLSAVRGNQTHHLCKRVRKMNPNYGYLRLHAVCSLREKIVTQRVKKLSSMQSQNLLPSSKIFRHYTLSRVILSTPYFIEIHFNITLPSDRSTFEWSVSFTIFDFNFVLISPFLHAAKCPALLNCLQCLTTCSQHQVHEQRGLYFSLSLLNTLRNF